MSKQNAHQNYLRKMAIETARERVRRARQNVKDARAAKRGARAHAQQACNEARRTLREWRTAERARVKAEIARLRSELAAGIAERKARVAQCCGPDKALAREEGNQLVAGTRAELAELLDAQRLERIWKNKGKGAKAPASSSTRREHRGESDHEVEVNLTPDQLIVWERVKGKIKAGTRRSRTEAFLEWMHDHSADVARILEDDAERQVREAIKHEAEQRKALEAMPKASEKRLRDYLAAGLEAIGVAGVPVVSPAAALTNVAIKHTSSRPPRPLSDRPTQAEAFEPLDELDVAPIERHSSRPRAFDASAAPAAPPGRVNIGKPYAHRLPLDHVGVGGIVTTQRTLHGPQGGISSGFPLIVTGIDGERVSLEDDKGRPFEAHADWLTYTNPNLSEFAGHPAKRSAEGDPDGPRLDLSAFAQRVHRAALLPDANRRIDKVHGVVATAGLREVYDAGRPWFEDFDTWKARVLEAHGERRLQLAENPGWLQTSGATATREQYDKLTGNLVRDELAFSTGGMDRNMRARPLAGRAAQLANRGGARLALRDAPPKRTKLAPPPQERAPKPAWHEAEPITAERFHPAGLRDAEDVGLSPAATPWEVRRNVLEYLEAHGGAQPYHVVNALLDLEEDHKPGGHGWRAVQRRLNLADDAAVSSAYDAMSAFIDPGDLKLGREKVLKRARRLLGKEPASSRKRAAPRSSPPPPEPAPAAAVFPLARFADQVKRVAYFDPSVERFHDDRAFIASVYDVLRPDMDLATFKARLIQAHRQGMLRLTRADLVSAMDVDLVERSEAEYMGATFNFIALDPQHAPLRVMRDSELPPDQLQARRTATAAHERLEAGAEVHKFELVGLGKAPFRFGRVSEFVTNTGKPSGTCAYCGQGIRYAAGIVSADGNRFHVGLDCAESSGDAGLRTKAMLWQRTHARDLNKKRKKSKAELNQEKHAVLLAELADMAENDLLDFPRRFANSLAKQIRQGKEPTPKQMQLFRKLRGEPESEPPVPF